MATKAVAALFDIVAVPAKNIIPMILATDGDETDDLFIVVFEFFSLLAIYQLSALKTRPFSMAMDDVKRFFLLIEKIDDASNVSKRMER